MNQSLIRDNLRKCNVYGHFNFRSRVNNLRSVATCAGERSMNEALLYVCVQKLVNSNVLLFDAGWKQMEAVLISDRLVR